MKAVSQRIVSSNDEVVIVNTGNGLKDIESAEKALNFVETNSYVVEPDLEEIKKYFYNS